MASKVILKQGLVTALIVGFLIFALGEAGFRGGERHTGAFAVLIYKIVKKFGFEGVAVATLMARCDGTVYSSTFSRLLNKMEEAYLLGVLLDAIEAIGQSV